jgi:type II secretory ATPase GspE/PulE/Tfp pilus assembly ATPase PilB-like protein
MDPNKDKAELYRAVGCPQCNDRGYIGRLAVYELMPITEGIRRLAIQEPTSDQVRELAVAAGMKSMRDHAIEKVLAGLTTLEEARKQVLMSDIAS